MCKIRKVIYKCSLSAAGAAFLVTLSACNNASTVSVNDGTLSARLVMPEPLLSARAPENPVPEVLLNGNALGATQDSDSLQWTAGINVAQNQQYQLEVRWKDGSSLIFADAADCFSTAGEAPIELSFSSDDYDTSIDEDGDGRSNLAELDNNTNPRDRDSPPERLSQSVLTLTVALPDVLRDLPGATLDSYQVKVLVNGLPVTGLSPNINNDGFLGQANVSVGSRAFVIVEWSYPLADSSTVRVARLARPQQINDGGDTFFEAKREDIYRVDYDRDSDGRNNLQEILSDSDPVSGVGVICTR